MQELTPHRLGRYHEPHDNRDCIEETQFRAFGYSVRGRKRSSWIDGLAALFGMGLVFGVTWGIALATLKALSLMAGWMLRLVGWN